MPNEPLPVWRLDYKDKVIHHEMARAHTYMLHVARAIREYKADDPDWLARADEIAGAAEILGGWMDGLREEAAEKAVTPEGKNAGNALVDNNNAAVTEKESKK